MRWNIHHTTGFRYAAPVSRSFNEVRLQPFSDESQTVENFELRISPATRVRQYHDFYSNTVHQFDVVESHSELTIEVHTLVTVHPKPPRPPELRTAPMPGVPEALKIGRNYDFILESRYVDCSPETWRLAIDATEGEDDAWQAALRVMRFVHGALTYQPNSTHAHTHMREVLAQRRGVCQDFAHVMIGMCRSLKIPALYVSGYLATQDASATHAWTEVFIPGAGWQALDPTHNRQTDETYIKIGVGRDYGDVPPVSGFYRGTTNRTLSVEVKIEERL